jgi:hypothetical protein
MVCGGVENDAGDQQIGIVRRGEFTANLVNAAV